MLKKFHGQLLNAEFQRFSESLGQNQKDDVKERKKRLTEGARKGLFVLGGGRFLGFLEIFEVREREEVVREDRFLREKESVWEKG